MQPPLSLESRSVAKQSYNIQAASKDWSDNTYALLEISCCGSCIQLDSVLRCTLCPNYFRMMRKYHNHKLQTNPWHREEEPHNNHDTSGRQTKQSYQLSVPQQDECKTRMDTQFRTTIHKTITDSHNGINNKQQVNNKRTTALERTAFYFY